MSVVSAPIPPKKRATVEELLAQMEATGKTLEIIDGEIVEKACDLPEQDASGPSHGFAIAGVMEAVAPFNHSAGSSKNRLGGWWICVNVHLRYPAGEVYEHDLSGFRRESHAERPSQFPVTARPDWVCEVLSDKKRDYVIKPSTLHDAHVPHYWLLDANERILLVHRWSPDGYIVVLRAAAGQTVRAEPFEAIEIQVSELFGDD